ncbi:RteC domain-containing protein [Autumnicola psychrophila]|uniref:RteC domain-containing protein n=1 Tax=Autumnicola psychrophila TaxID=3075592 RepID=A0ABU3DMD5_9FLAO|nr:RteC domain-containing protein [Zunongwangia sp. F225]MDT0684878.1 RteC domain-containing protein [Zunongwangia sp. F225]
MEIFMSDLYYDILIFINNYKVLPYQVKAYFNTTYKRPLLYNGVPLQTKEKYHFLLFEAIVQQITGVLAVDKNLPSLPIQSQAHLLPEYDFIQAFHNKLEEFHTPEKDNIITEFFTFHNPLPKYSQQDTLDFKKSILSLDKHYKVNSILQERELKNLQQQNKIQWMGTPLELAELIKALIEAKKINGGSEKQVFDFLQLLFTLPFDKREKLQSIRKRSTNLTPLLHELEFHLKQWINRS